MESRGRSTDLRVIGLAALLIISLAVPAAAVFSFEGLPPAHQDKFADDFWDVAAEPTFRATVVQSEVNPGSPQQLNVIVTNLGEVSDFKSINDPVTGSPAISSDPTNDTKAAAKERALDQGGTTAKSLIATLEEDGPFQVQTSTATVPQPVASGASATLPFTLTVDEDADPGTYELNLTLNYRYVYDAAVFYKNNQFLEHMYHRNKNETIAIEVTVGGKTNFQVESVEIEEGEARLGREPTLRVTYRNTGTEVANDAEASLAPNPPITAASGMSAGAGTDTTFLGDVAPGETASATYDLSISRDGLAKNYSLPTTVSYEDSGGNQKTSKPLKAVLSVKPYSPQFEVVDSELESGLTPGGSSTLTVTFRNDGKKTAQDAVSRISVSDTFTSTSDTSFLGDLAPGETATATFSISAASDAQAKGYGVDSEIKYRDDRGRTQLSDSMKVPVEIAGGGGGSPVPGPGPLLAVAGLALSALIYRRRC